MGIANIFCVYFSEFLRLLDKIRMGYILDKVNISFRLYFQDLGTINSFFRDKIRNLMKEERATFVLRRLIF